MVDEGETFTVSARCDGITAQVYDFEIGVGASGNLRASSARFTSGTCANAVGTNTLVAINQPDRYAVSRRSPSPAARGNFSLSSVEYHIPQVRNTTQVTITLNRLLLGDWLGAQLNVSTLPVAAITIRNVA